MDQHTMVEQAYKNGYAKGLEEGRKTAAVHGRWVDRYGLKFANNLFECSVCKRTAKYEWKRDELGHERVEQALTDYCPNCGAMMIKEAENE